MNSQEIFQWVRYWCESDGNAYNDKTNILTFDGFLDVPDEGLEPFIEINTFEQINHIQCLVLLGEPGIGKSFELKNAYKIFKNNNRDDEIHFFVDLNIISDRAGLNEEIFEKNTFKEWLDTSMTLYLYLDSFDECFVSYNTLFNELSSKLKIEKINKIKLRIASRTAYWKKYYNDKLKEIYGKDNVKLFDLLPLSKKDITCVTKYFQIKEELFFIEIERTNTSSLANKPLTLFQLVKSFKKNNQLDNSIIEYKNGLISFCKEQNESRSSSCKEYTLNPIALFEVISKIAAISLLSSKYVYCFDTKPSNIFELDTDLLSENIKFNSDSIKLNRKLLNEIFSTPFFSSRGPNKFGWAHKSYLEFSAAYYLYKLDMNKEKLLSVFLDSQGYIIPQLKDTACWLANFDNKVFDSLIEYNCQDLLFSDLSMLDDMRKSILVTTLLDKFAKEEISENYLFMEKRYQYLDHKTLSEQLKPYIINPNTNTQTKILALKIAAACKLKNLQSDLLILLKDKSIKYVTRRVSAYALLKIGDVNFKKNLYFLLELQEDEDPDEELLGIALKILWPDIIDTKLAFNYVHPPRNRILFGSYKNFFEYFVSKFNKNDLLIGLDWVSNNQNHNNDGNISMLIPLIFNKAINFLDSNDVIISLAKAIHSIKHSDTYSLSLQNFGEELVEFLRNNNEYRHKLLVELLKISKKDEICYFLGEPFCLLQGNDYEWVLKNLRFSNNNEEKLIWINLIIVIMNSMDTYVWEKILDLCYKDRFISCHLLPYFKVDIKSTLYKNRKESYYRQKQIQERSLEVPLDPNPGETIKNLLDSYKKGNPRNYEQLIETLFFSPSQTELNIEDFFDNDITEYHGWKNADEETKQAIIRLAKEYLEYKKSSKKDTHSFTFNDVIPFKSLIFLCNIDASYISGLSRNFWLKWCSDILIWENFSNRKIRKTRLQLLKYAYMQVKETMLQYIRAMIIKNIVSDYEFFEVLWDDDIENMLLEIIKNNETNKMDKIERILDILFLHNSVATENYIFAIIKEPIPRAKLSRNKYKIYITYLLINNGDKYWYIIKKKLAKSEDICNSVIKKLAAANYRYDKNVVFKLDPSQIADLYIFTTMHFSYEEYSISNLKESGKCGLYGMENQSRNLIYDIDRFRNNLLKNLENIGTKESCISIEKIINKFPKYAWLKNVLLQAKQKTRQNSWNPLSFENAKKFLDDKNSRSIQNGEQLMHVVIESLHDLTNKLHAETPSVIDIWNRKINNKNVYNPKTENELSDYIKRHIHDYFDKKCIVIGREVQIHKKEKTDIHITALSKDNTNDEFNHIKLIIEVKGCWNKDINTSMKSQLMEKYLKNNDCNYGIYLIGWFLCDKWDKSDSRYKQTQKNKKQLEEKLHNQAEKISNNIKKIKPFILDCTMIY